MTELWLRQTLLLSGLARITYNFPKINDLFMKDIDIFTRKDYIEIGSSKFIAINKVTDSHGDYFIYVNEN